MSRKVVLRCKVVEGDTLDFIAGMFYKKTASARRRIALENHLRAGSALRPGQVLRIVEPDYFPDPGEFKRRRQERDKTTREGIKAPGGKGGSPPPPLAFSESDNADDEKDVVQVPRPKANRAFAPGEKLVYEVRVLSILAGHASLEVDPFTKLAGRPCYPIVARATAAFPFRTVYRVDDVQTSYFDTVDFLTWKFENEVHEGSYYAHNLELYDQLGHKLARRHNQEAWESIDIPPFDQDIISCFYYFRLLPLEAGKEYAIPTTSGGRNYKLLTRVIGREKVTVPAGTFDCLRLKPMVKYETVFRNKEDIDLWVTADERHIPVRVKSAIVIGNIDIVLLEAVLPDLARVAAGKRKP
jgi:phage tail protein X